MQLKVYSLKKTLFEGEAKSVNCKTAVGEITILDHHKPLISIVTAGAMKIIDGQNKEHFIDVASGIVKVAANQATLLVEQTA